jgi:pimeloyl-ACP methyl ester carboxylesterase
MQPRRVVLATTGLLAAILLSVAGFYGPRMILKLAMRQLQRTWAQVAGNLVLVDVGGYRLHIQTKGNGVPTVVMESGLCQPTSTWGQLPNAIAKFTRVVTYDRAGLGLSDFPSQRRTSQDIVAELNRLLRNVGIPGPYVLVGHSFGGLNVRLYASQYPDQVVGMIFVDAAHEQQFNRFASLMSADKAQSYLQHEGGENCERVDLLASAKQVHAAAPLPAIPLLVLTADRSISADSTLNSKMLQAGKEMQSDLAQLTPISKHVVAEKSGHFIQLDRSELVIQSIRSIVDIARLNLRSQSPRGKLHISTVGDSKFALTTEALTVRRGTVDCSKSVILSNRC